MIRSVLIVLLTITGATGFITGFFILLKLTDTAGYFTHIFLPEFSPDNILLPAIVIIVILGMIPIITAYGLKEFYNWAWKLSVTIGIFLAMWMVILMFAVGFDWLIFLYFLIGGSIAGLSLYYIYSDIGWV